MIEIVLDHSFADDYFIISNIYVNIEDEVERERFTMIIEKKGLIGSLVDPDRFLSKRLAEAIGVDENRIEIDTQEIDIM